MTIEVPDTAVCTCDPDTGCDGEGYEPDDPRTCPYCMTADGELPCPADPNAYDGVIESLMDTVHKEAGFDPNVVCADGSEPFASVALGYGLVLDLTAKVRRLERRAGVSDAE